MGGVLSHDRAAAVALAGVVSALGRPGAQVALIDDAVAAFKIVGALGEVDERHRYLLQIGRKHFHRVDLLSRLAVNPDRVPLSVVYRMPR